MSEMIYKIPLRKKEYDVHVRDSIGACTTMWFKYCNTTLTDDVYLPTDLSTSEINRILTTKVASNIRKYNNKRWMVKKCNHLKKLSSGNV